MTDDRKEERNLRKFQVLLSCMGEPLPIEPASTENVSSHGMRVLTERLLRPDTLLIVESWENKLWARAKVVYCQALPGKTFAIGLELLARTGDWGKEQESEQVA